MRCPPRDPGPGETPQPQRQSQEEQPAEGAYGPAASGRRATSLGSQPSARTDDEPKVADHRVAVPGHHLPLHAVLPRRKTLQDLGAQNARLLGCLHLPNARSIAHAGLDA